LHYCFIVLILSICFFSQHSFTQSMITATHTHTQRESS